MSNPTPICLLPPAALPGPQWPAWIEALRRDHYLMSASSYSLAKRCLRRWAYKEIAKKREPEDSAKAFGTEGHRQVEEFLRDGTAPDLSTKEGRCVLESIPHLPKPCTAQVEVPFAFELEKAWFWGRIDVVGGTYRDGVEHRKADHKFVRSLDYAHTPDTLVQDPAAVLYTLAPPAWPTTMLRWVYNSKTRKQSSPVDATLEIGAALEYAHEHLVPAWHVLDGIRRLFSGHTPSDALPLLNAVPCNPLDCLAFNRPCVHMAYCTRVGAGMLET